MNQPVTPPGDKKKNGSFACASNHQMRIEIRVGVPKEKLRR